MTKEKLMEWGLTEEQATNTIKGGGRAFSSIILSLPLKAGLVGQCPFGGIGRLFYPNNAGLPQF